MQYEKKLYRNKILLSFLEKVCKDIFRWFKGILRFSELYKLWWSRNYEHVESMNTSKDSSAMYYQDDKKTTKKVRQRYQSLSKEKQNQKSAIWVWMIEISPSRWETRTS